VAIPKPGHFDRISKSSNWNLVMRSLWERFKPDLEQKRRSS